MADYHEVCLAAYQKELEKQYQEEYERAQNPKIYWKIIAQNDHLLPEWEEYTDTEEEKEKLISSAKKDGLHVVCTKFIEGGSPK